MNAYYLRWMAPLGILMTWLVRCKLCRERKLLRFCCNMRLLTIFVFTIGFVRKGAKPVVVYEVTGVEVAYGFVVAYGVDVTKGVDVLIGVVVSAGVVVAAGVVVLMGVVVA